jgi:hypothetical protein
VRRSVPEFAVTATCVLPDPFPSRAVVIDIHATSAATVQAHPVSVVTDTVSEPPSEPMDAADRSSEYRHGAASCVISIDDPATTIAPLRALGVLFAVTPKLIVAAPCPLAGPSTAIQVTAGCMAHAQSRSAAIVTAPVPPAAPNEARELAAVIWHFAEPGAVTLREEDEEVHAAAAAARTAVPNQENPRGTRQR